jgi:hypothetical protein
MALGGKSQSICEYMLELVTVKEYNDKAKQVSKYRRVLFVKFNALGALTVIFVKLNALGALTVLFVELNALGALTSSFKYLINLFHSFRKCSPCTKEPGF